MICFYQKIPIEIWKGVFEFILIEEVANAHCISKEFYHIVHHNNKRIISRLSDKIQTIPNVPYSWKKFYGNHHVFYFGGDEEVIKMQMNPVNSQWEIKEKWTSNGIPLGMYQNDTLWYDEKNLQFYISSVSPLIPETILKLEGNYHPHTMQGYHMNSAGIFILDSWGCIFKYTKEGKSITCTPLLIDIFSKTTRDYESLGLAGTEKYVARGWIYNETNGVRISIFDAQTLKLITDFVQCNVEICRFGITNDFIFYLDTAKILHVYTLHTLRSVFQSPLNIEDNDLLVSFVPHGLFICAIFDHDSFLSLRFYPFQF